MNWKMKTNLEKLKEEMIYWDVRQKNYIREEWLKKICNAILKDIDEAGWNRYIEGNEITRLIKKGLKDDGTHKTN